MKSTCLLPLLALLGACSGPRPEAGGGPVIDANTITFNNFEAGGGWSNDPGRNDPNLIAKGQAHSGQYALVINHDHEYSLAFDMPLGRISSRKFKVIHLEAWAYLPSEHGAANINLQILQPDGNGQVTAGNLELGSAVKTYHEWVKVEKDFPMPDNITAVQRLHVFVWRAGATDEVLLDDVLLSIKE
ncbi:MAG: hypothetical protein ACRYFX_00960 [Janthinobacterium lividum]